MTIEEKQLEFMIYCIESTAERLGRYGSDVYNKLKELGAIECLFFGYGCLSCLAISLFMFRNL